MGANPSKPRPFRLLSTGTIFGSSAIHVAAMSDGCNEHQELAVFNFADDPKIAHAISPQSRQCSVQWLAYSARPVPIGDTLSQVGHDPLRSEEHTSELQSLMRISYAVFCLKKKTKTNNERTPTI